MRSANFGENIIRHDPRCKAFYARLIAAGKAPKLAIIAVARKLLLSPALSSEINPLCTMTQKHSCPGQARG